MGVVSSVVDAAFRSILDEMFGEGEAFEYDAPRGGALVFDGFPHELGDDENYHPVARTD